MSPSSVQFSWVAQSCLTLCNPMNRSTPDLPVHHQLPESTQTHIHWVGDAIQPSHPLSSPSPALNLSQHQGFSNESALKGEKIQEENRDYVIHNILTDEKVEVIYTLQWWRVCPKERVFHSSLNEQNLTVSFLRVNNLIDCSTFRVDFEMY